MTATEKNHPLVVELTKHLPAGAVVTDPDLLASFERDSASLCDFHLPLAAVVPSTENEVRTAITLAAAHRVPVVPQGALTGLAGAANSVRGGIVLNTRRLNRIRHIDPANRVAVVEPGVSNKELREAAAEHGLTYRPEPSSWESSTIGGNIATDAGGLCCVKYGVTRRFVRGLRVVLADGRITAIGRSTIKGVAGLSLTDLFVGSEGTLGIITEATVALDTPAEAPLTLAATFHEATDAGRAVAAVRARGMTPSLFELVDRTTLRAIDAHARMGLGDAGALLIAQSDSGTGAGQELDIIAEACHEADAIDVVVGEDPAESEQLIQARRLAHPALEALGPLLVDDVAVPVSELAWIIGEIEALAQRAGLTIGVVGHAGDGNLHPAVVVDPTNPSSLEAAHRAINDIVDLALSVGGTVTGEHGIGLLKVPMLERELDPVAADLQRQIKELFDPHYLLNPGKVMTAPAVNE
ncbi:FAD-binding protein [Saccharopolyspora terrae]|uniref:FAD-binding protein n=1 Tax=Saccharopolyspora terrae TaxID=2530384 RepID=A0A4R4W0E6_9PSEU|nr:FAD-linked oxidase C-terminal domain-containing protein [Saccharopolyspora terrae]TDD10187.1 FAD-binding protein [Saccharopolyspora terrae]